MKIHSCETLREWNVSRKHYLSLSLDEYFIVMVRLKVLKPAKGGPSTGFILVLKKSDVIVALVVDKILYRNHSVIGNTIEYLLSSYAAALKSGTVVGQELRLFSILERIRDV